MVQIKPVIEERDVLALLSEHFGSTFAGLETPRTGEIARTYFFTVGDDEYVVRFNRGDLGANLPKEAYLYANYASHRIPIPEILKVGRRGDLHYAISRRVPGEPVVALPYPVYQMLIPSLLDTLDAIHEVEVVDGRGYGPFGDDGAASSQVGGIPSSSSGRKRRYGSSTGSGIASSRTPSWSENCSTASTTA
ncbi:MAG: phosphotransferase [Chloroflexia bacterium]